jgi:ABC-2 type transport system ATP-binding protein
VEFDKDPGMKLLSGIAKVTSVTRIEDNIYMVKSETDEDIRASLFRFAVDNGYTVLSLQKQESNLEEIFRHLTT